MSSTPPITGETERAFVGAVLHQEPARILAVAGLVRESDIEDPRVAVVYRLAVELAAQGISPDPARVQGHAITTGAVTRSQCASLTGLVVDLYREVPLPAAIESYGRIVVEVAARTRVTKAAQRLADAADSLSLEYLVTLVDDETRAMLGALGRLTAAPLGGTA